MRSLAIPLRRAHITAFWLLFTTATAVGLASLAVIAGWSPALAAAAMLPMLPRIHDRHWFETGVRGWNGVVRRASAPLRRYVLRVAYLAVCTAGALPVTSLGLEWPSGSKWHERTQRPSGRWPAFLKPALWILWVFRDETHETTPPSSTSYTLY